MDNAGSTGIAITMLLISSVFIGATVFNVTSNETDDNISENDLADLAQQVTDDTVDEITTYLETPYSLGKYYGPANNQKIEKIVIMLESWISKDINMSDNARKQFQAVFKNVARAQVTVDPSSLADGAGETKSVTVAGAALGDMVLVSAPYDLQDITVTGYVQAANTVEIRIQNEGGATVDLASGTWNVMCLRPDFGN